MAVAGFEGFSIRPSALQQLENTTCDRHQARSETRRWGRGYGVGGRPTMKKVSAAASWPNSEKLDKIYTNREMFFLKGHLC